MVFRFFVSTKDPYVTDWLGIIGNQTFDNLLYLYELDPYSKKIELVGIDRDTPLNRRKYMSWGFRDLTKEVYDLVKPIPTKIDLFTFKITSMLHKYPKLIRSIEKFKK